APIATMGSGILGSVTSSSLTDIFFLPSDLSRKVDVIPQSDQQSDNSSTSSNLTAVRKTSNTSVDQRFDDSRTSSNIGSVSFEFVSDIYPELHCAAGRILFFISASNWNTVYTRIKSCIVSLAKNPNQVASKAGGDGLYESSGEMTELRFLEWCNLNTKRLGVLIS
ncbi:hypothetical protein HK096_000081, partial [Nowakowskiella sp. JEL0078]